MANTERSPYEPVTLLEYLEQRIHLEIARVDTEIKRIDRAGEVFRATYEERHEQLRQELSATFDAQIHSLSDKVGLLGNQVARMLISLLVSIVGVLVAALVVVATSR